MPVVKPFRAFHYNTQTVKDISQVAIPPYDVIKEGDAKRYLKKSPYNFAHVLLPHSAKEDYTEASKTIQNWFKANIFVEDAAPGFYLYQQTFEWQGAKHRRNTLMASVLISEYSDKHILPHENTHGEFKEDRLQILRKTQCNLSHVFGMVKDQEGFLQHLYEGVSFKAPIIKTVTDDKIEQIVWKIPAEHTQSIENFFKDQAIFILDGHHRYESSRLYAKEKGVFGNTQEPAAYMLFAILNSLDPALLVLPTHRVFSKLPTTFSLDSMESFFEIQNVDLEGLKKFANTEADFTGFGLYLHGKCYLLKGKKSAPLNAKGALKDLAVVWSDEVLISQGFQVPKDKKTQWIQYEKDTGSLISSLDKYEAVVFHAPPPVESVVKVASEGEFMPQKSTFFYPKLTAGLVMRRLTS